MWGEGHWIWWGTEYPELSIHVPAEKPRRDSLKRSERKSSIAHVVWITTKTHVEKITKELKVSADEDNKSGIGRVG